MFIGQFHTHVVGAVLPELRGYKKDIHLEGKSAEGNRQGFGEKEAIDVIIFSLYAACSP